MAGQIQTLQEMINQVVKGKQKVVEKVLCAMLAGGHILLEDIPGVGKTTLAMAIAKATDLTYRRVQFTPDVLPSDLVGFSMYNEKTKNLNTAKVPYLPICFWQMKSTGLRRKPSQHFWRRWRKKR